MDRDQPKVKRRRSVSPPQQRLLPAPPQPPQNLPSAESASSRPRQTPFARPNRLPPPLAAAGPLYFPQHTSFPHSAPAPLPEVQNIVPNPVYDASLIAQLQLRGHLVHFPPLPPPARFVLGPPAYAQHRQLILQARPPPSHLRAPSSALTYYRNPDPVQAPQHPPHAPRLSYTSLSPLQSHLPPPFLGQTFTFAPQRSSIPLRVPPPTMPYNTTAIPPRREPTGATQLPLSRVKKIITLDTDINTCSNNAAFVITIATEMFIQYMAEQGHNVVKSERKPRRNIQYRDLSNAVARLDNLEFLADIVPRTVPYKEVKEKKAPTGPAKATNGESSMEHGQTTLEGSRPPPPMNGMNGFGHDGANDDGDDSTIADPNQQLEMEIRGARVSTGSIGDVMNGQDQAPRDVEMSQ